MWTQVHHGQLPLWNPFSGLGMPLAFNWQSAPFGLSALVGYLVPLRYAYTVGVIVTVVVAGTGAYVLGRVLQLGALGCAMAGTVFELSGPMVGWAGWPHAAVFAWTGWIFAASILIVRGRHRVRDIAFLAVVLAAAVYSGQPEILGLILLSLFLFLLVLLGGRALRNGVVSVVRSGLDLAVAVVAGAALSAPLALPGEQVALASVHGAAKGVHPLGARDFLWLIFQGYSGLPIVGSRVGNFGAIYVPAYVGVTTLVLAAAGLVLVFRSNRIRLEIAAFVVVTVAAVLIAYSAFSPALTSLIRDLPVVGTEPTHALLAAAFGFAMLAGIGIDALGRTERRRTWLYVGGAFILAGVVIGAFFVFGHSGLPAAEERVRARSFIWPAVQVAVGLVAAGAVVVVTRIRGRRAPHVVSRRLRHPAKLAAFFFLAVESAFLVTAGAPIFSSSSTFFAPTPAESRFQSLVGSSLVGSAQGSVKYACVPMGIIPDVNVVFGVHELNVYDPTIPLDYYTSFRQLTGESAGARSFNSYCPAIKTVQLARLYGVQYILQSTGVRGPAGTTFVTKLGNENLYRVPGAFPATLTPLTAGGGYPSISAAGTPVRVTYPGTATWSVVTKASTPQVLRLRLSDVDGWHASIDGKPLTLTRYGGIMLQAKVPPGRHQIELHYWPDSFTAGIVLAACSLVALVAALVVDRVRRRRAI